METDKQFPNSPRRLACPLKSVETLEGCAKPNQKNPLIKYYRMPDDLDMLKYPIIHIVRVRWNEA
jgi:hypothetical protein